MQSLNSFHFAEYIYRIAQEGRRKGYMPSQLTWIMNRDNLERVWSDRELYERGFYTRGPRESEKLFGSPIIEIHTGRYEKQIDLMVNIGAAFNYVDLFEPPELKSIKIPDLKLPDAYIHSTGESHGK